MIPAELPPTLDRVTIPKFFAPSGLGNSGDCGLRLVASDVAFEALRLIPGPQAALGTLYHRAIAIWARGVAETPQAAFASAAKEVDATIAADARRAHQAPLQGTVSLQQWLGFKTRTLRACMRIRGSKSAGAGDPIQRQIGTGRRVIETTRESNRYRLRGRPDVVRWLGYNRLEVRDFKSGAIVDADGNMMESIRLQLWAYGLMILDEFPKVIVELIVDDGADHRIPFGQTEQRIAADQISEKLRGLSVDAEMSSAEIARPGQACVSCGIRHICSAYKTAAPEWWRSVPDGMKQLPNDSWGTLLEIEERDESMRVRIEDVARRTVAIDTLSHRHGISTDSLGKPFAFFNLAPRGRSRSPDGIAFHPHNFYELPRDNYERRAWSAEVFRVEWSG